MGTAAATAGAAGPSRDYWLDGAAGGLRSLSLGTQRTKLPGDFPGAGRRVSPMHGTRSQITCNVRQGKGQARCPSPIIALFFIFVCLASEGLVKGSSWRLCRVRTVITQAAFL
jgi:hypothetical protein